MSSHEHNVDRTEQVVSTLLSAAGKAPVPPDEAFLDRLSGEAMKAFIAASAQRPERFWRNRIMHLRTVKWLVPIAAAAAVIVAVGLWPSSSGRGVALAQVIQHLRSAHTLTCKMSFSANGETRGTANYMFRGDHLLRIEDSNGQIVILDMAASRGLLLDANRKTADPFAKIPTRRFDFYKAVTNFRDGTETPLGTRRIQGRDAVGFLLPNLNPSNIEDDATPPPGRISLWIDAKTLLPIQMEDRSTTHDGQELVAIFEDFVLDTDLDESLFSLSVPAGYADGGFRVIRGRVLSLSEPAGDAGDNVASTEWAKAREMALRSSSAATISQLVKACIKSAADHQGQWPENLQSLEAYGINASGMQNRRFPAAAVGWIYRRPTLPPDRLANPSKTVVIHEPLEPWSDGVTVGFADGHVEFVSDQNTLNSLLAQ